MQSLATPGAIPPVSHQDPFAALVRYSVQGVESAPTTTQSRACTADLLQNSVCPDILSKKSSMKAFHLLALLLGVLLVLLALLSASQVLSSTVPSTSKNSLFSIQITDLNAQHLLCTPLLHVGKLRYRVEK